MRLTTIRAPDGTHAALVDGDEVVQLPYSDLVSLLAEPDWAQAAADGPRAPLDQASLAPVVRPGKVLCLGLNYRTHILEMGRELPEHPTLFAKFADTLTGPNDDIALPEASEQVDWEVELGVVIGRTARHVREDDAFDHIAGYTVVNDVSMRDWQWRTTQWLQGKTFEATTPVGPMLVTPDEIDHARDLALTCEIDGEVMQDARTSDLLFPPATIVAYLSRIMTLRPGDLIATGTPGGVGVGRDPKVFLTSGQTLRSTIEGIGSCQNTLVKDLDPHAGERTGVRRAS